jgi:hypothetical protein
MGGWLRPAIVALLACAGLVFAPMAFARANPPAGEVVHGEQLTFSNPSGAHRFSVSNGSRQTCPPPSEGPLTFTARVVVFDGSGRTFRFPAASGSNGFSVSFPATRTSRGLWVVDMYILGSCRLAGHAMGVWSATAQWGPYRAVSKLERCSKPFWPTSGEDLYDVVIGCDIETITNPKAPLGEKAWVVLTSLPQFRAARVAPAPVRRQILSSLFDSLKKIDTRKLATPEAAIRKAAESPVVRKQLLRANLKIPEVRQKLPSSWTEEAVRKGEGFRIKDPKNPVGNIVRIDKGNPNSRWPSQRVDHVVVHSNGRILGPDGKPLPPHSTLKENPQAHIPLSEYLKWKSWNSRA